MATEVLRHSIPAAHGTQRRLPLYVFPVTCVHAATNARHSDATSFFDGCLSIRETVNDATAPASLYMADYFYSNGRDRHATN